MSTIPPSIPISREPKLGYRVHDVARMLDVSDRTVWRMLKAGSLQCFKVGTNRRMVRIPASEIARITGAGTVTPTRAPSPEALRIAREMLREGVR